MARRSDMHQVLVRPSILSTLFSVPSVKKNYVGRTVNSLHKRVDGHRSKFYEIIDGRAVDITSDEYSLGVHLIDHGLGKHTNFNENFILENCSPSQLEVKENKYIHLLLSLRPHGLNTINPFG
jgi:hypothetical protein